MKARKKGNTILGETVYKWGGLIREDNKDIRQNDKNDNGGGKKWEYKKRTIDITGEIEVEFETNCISNESTLEFMRNG